MRRINCLVPGCKRTRGDRKNDPVRPGQAWICRDHWQPLPRLWRRAFRRACRRENDAASFGTIENGYRNFHEKKRLIEYRRACASFDRLWNRLRRAAIELAMGI